MTIKSCNLNRLTTTGSAHYFHRHRRSRQVFRNPTVSRKPTHLPRQARLAAKPRISVGGPFGEVVKKTGAASSVPFRFSTKYQDDETVLLYYGYRYYQPSVGRWASRDPLGDYAFSSVYRTDKTDEEKIALWWESLRPTYTFIYNDGINNIDRLGLDRWLVISGIHAYVVVEHWDDCCKKDDKYKRIDFYPNNWWGIIIAGPGVVYVNPSSQPTGLSATHFTSECKGDKELLKWAEDKQLNPPWYSLQYFNCTTFSGIALLIGM